MGVEYENYVTIKIKTAQFGDEKYTGIPMGRNRYGYISSGLFYRIDEGHKEHIYPTCDIKKIEIIRIPK